MYTLKDLEEKFRFSDKFDGLVLSYTLYEEGFQKWLYERIIGDVGLNAAVLKFYRDEAVQQVNREMKVL